jgi:hypothetical protein
MIIQTGALGRDAWEMFSGVEAALRELVNDGAAAEPPDERRGFSASSKLVNFVGTG